MAQYENKEVVAKTLIAASEEIKKIKQKLKQDIKETRQARKRQIKEENLSKPPRHSIEEEIFHSISHGIGAGLSIAALVLLILRALNYAPPSEVSYYVTGFSVFGSSLFLLYISSTLYHALIPYTAKRAFAILDHCTIYVLIAGTYTAYCLGVLRPNPGWWMFGVIWGLAILFLVLWPNLGKVWRAKYTLFTYIVMGWFIVFAWNTLTEKVSTACLVLLITGGVSYTAGAIFYSLKKIKWFHSIWHLFVLLGSILHFFSVYYSIG